MSPTSPVPADRDSRMASVMAEGSGGVTAIRSMA